MSSLGKPNSERLRLLVNALGKKKTFVNLGLGEGKSADIMLSINGTDNKIYTVEILKEGIQLFNKKYVDYPNHFIIRGDSVTVGKKFGIRNHLTFFDTLHTREQIMCELYYWWDTIFANGWAVFHDTAWEENKHDNFLGKDWPHVSKGIEEFFQLPQPLEDITAYDNEFIYVEHHKEDYGMTFIMKKKAHSFNVKVDGKVWDNVFSTRDEIIKSLKGPGWVADNIDIPLSATRGKKSL